MSDRAAPPWPSHGAGSPQGALPFNSFARLTQLKTTKSALSFAKPQPGLRDTYGDGSPRRSSSNSFPSHHTSPTFPKPVHHIEIDTHAPPPGAASPRRPHAAREHADPAVRLRERQISSLIAQRGVPDSEIARILTQQRDDAREIAALRAELDALREKVSEMRAAMAGAAAERQELRAELQKLRDEAQRARLAPGPAASLPARLAATQLGGPEVSDSLLEASEFAAPLAPATRPGSKQAALLHKARELRAQLGLTFEPRDAPSAAAQELRCVVRYEFQARPGKDHEMSVPKGVTVTVREVTDAGWAIAEHGGESGHVPAAYLATEDGEQPPPGRYGGGGSDAPQLVRATAPFTPSGPGQLELGQQRYYALVNPTEADGWSRVRDLVSGHEGLAPSAYLHATGGAASAPFVAALRDLLRGSIFVKHHQRGKSAVRLMRVSPDLEFVLWMPPSSKKPSSLAVAQITGVRVSPTNAAVLEVLSHERVLRLECMSAAEAQQRVAAFHALLRATRPAM